MLMCLLIGGYVIAYRVRGVAVSRLLCMQKAPGSSPGESTYLHISFVAFLERLDIVVPECTELTRHCVRVVKELD